MMQTILFTVTGVIIGLAISFIILMLRKLSHLNKLAPQLEEQLHQEVEKQTALNEELIEVKKQYAHNLLHDPLTGLPGRQIFEDRMLQTMNQSQRYQMNFAILFLDLDGFKIINDALGHEVGDLLLKEVAVRLQDSIRQVDTVSRFAGDEFVFILPQLSKPETAAFVAQRVLDTLSLPFLIHNQELFITGSIGISVFPKDSTDVKVILKNADNAMHQAKSRGRNVYQFYREEMHARSHRELILSSSLQNESVYRDFTVYYQPQVNVETKNIISMQALLQWQHPDFGLISLHEFLGLAENSGKITEIGEWLIHQSLQQLENWKQLGFLLRGIAVNVSVRQLENPHFTYKISQILQETNIDPGNLILEISEGILLNKVELIEKVSHMLKHLGVQIAIADFGTGHLSLQDLKRFPIDYLKIAESLINDITINKESEAIVKMIIALAKSLQITVVAEGVESIKQLQLLQELGCIHMQGKLFGNPCPAEKFSSANIADAFPPS